MKKLITKILMTALLLGTLPAKKAEAGIVIGLMTGGAMLANGSNEGDRKTTIVGGIMYLLLGAVNVMIVLDADGSLNELNKDSHGEAYVILSREETEQTLEKADLTANEVELVVKELDV